VLSHKQEMNILKVCKGSVKGFYVEFSYQVLRASMPVNLHIVAGQPVKTWQYMEKVHASPFEISHGDTQQVVAHVRS
jgi:hypothetical protein